MDCRDVISALSAEFGDFAERLARLQDIPLLPVDADQLLTGEHLLNAMVALQDLDRLSQDAAALFDFTSRLAGERDLTATIKDELAAMSLRSVAERVQARLL